ncbi:MAG: helicase-related protein [Candidatus Binataceae bacterium]
MQIVRADTERRELDLKVIAPGPELGSIATHPHWDAMYDAVAQLVREHNTTLIFTLSRRWAERIALALQKRLGNDAVASHHGSLARAERLDAEQRLKRGELKALVATASLELGIDVGAVDLVCQIDSPKSIAAAIQRVGRSGHRPGAMPQGRFFALNLDDLIECAAAVYAIRNGRMDEAEVPSLCMDVLAQQIVAIAAEEEEIATADLIELLRGAYNFAALEADDLTRLLGEMAAQTPERIAGAGPKIFHDRVSNQIRPRRGARLAALTSGGTIPESGNYDVVIEADNRKIGDVEEDFAQEASRHDVFALGSMPWRILRISKNRLMVEPAPGMAPTLPWWQTEAGGRSRALSAEVSTVRREIAARLQQAEGGEAAAAQWLTDACGVEPAAAVQAVAQVRRGLAALGALPGEQTIIFERFFDGLGGTQIVIHAPFGIRFNRGLGLALRKRLCQSFDFEIQASAIDDAVLLALNSRHSFPLDQLPPMLNSRTVRDCLTQALLDAPMFEVRLRHVATRALYIMRSMRGRKVPAWIQRLRTQELITSLFPQRNACFENRPPAIEIPDHFVVGETVRECLSETTDASLLETVMRGLEDHSINAVFVDSIAPSVFAQRILLAWDYSFLDGGERANRRSRTVTTNRSIAEDAFRNEDLSAMLSAQAVASVAAQLNGDGPSRPRTPDEWHELVRNHGAIAACSNLMSVRPGGDEGAAERLAILATLEDQGRLIRIRTDSDSAEVMITAEDAPLFSAAYPRVAFARSVPALQPYAEPARAREEIVRRALTTSGPVTVAQLADRLNLPPADIAINLAALEASGAAFRGHFTTPANSLTGARRGTEQWCDRYVLERIHRMTLERLRAEVEPCSDQEFAAFRLRWCHIGGADLPPGVEGVRAVMEQMAGLALSPSLWEAAILPARVPGYRPEYLDLLCMGGELRWVAAPNNDDAVVDTPGVPARVAFVARQASFPLSFATSDEPNGEAPDDTKLNAVTTALRNGGAQYLDQIADRAELSERDALIALWKLAARGLVSNDSFAPLRLLSSEPNAINLVGDAPPLRASRRGPIRHDAAVRARLKSSISGRWSLIDSTVDSAHSTPSMRAGDAHAFDHVRAIALQLLARHGILAREMLAAESIAVTWKDLAFALRRMEYGGMIRRGYFVRSLSGEQYALPEALEMLRATRSAPSSPPIALSASDPANPYGAMLPGCGIARETGNLIVLQDGRVILGFSGKSMQAADALGDEAFAAALAALMKLRPRLTVETIDDVPALESRWVRTLAAMRFHSNGRALVCDGLHGPSPMIVRPPQTEALLR